MVRQRDDVYDLRASDLAMNAAIDRARATLPFFNRYVARAAKDGLDPRLKAEFRHDDGAEHMWVGDLTFDGRVYRGTLRNRPLHLTNVREGDRVTITLERVSDWSVVVEGTPLGNFTTLVIRGRLTPEERAEYDQVTGLRFVSDTALVAPPRP
jgi:uncharacterized protein YegJ (DUF2314 family)